mmetsp:Transcript_15791/g.45132  ORF Transcript_15791/g.45132 Transcript_15791/m.45132 type:complete len:285 (+) Transcript_15791:1799-2653(+)
MLNGRPTQRAPPASPSQAAHQIPQLPDVLQLLPQLVHLLPPLSVPDAPIHREAATRKKLLKSTERLARHIHRVDGLLPPVYQPLDQLSRLALVRRKLRHLLLVLIIHERVLLLHLHLRQPLLPRNLRLLRRHVRVPVLALHRLLPLPNLLRVLVDIPVFILLPLLHKLFNLIHVLGKLEHRRQDPLEQRILNHRILCRQRRDPKHTDLLDQYGSQRLHRPPQRGVVQITTLQKRQLLHPLKVPQRLVVRHQPVLQRHLPTENPERRLLLHLLLQFLAPILPTQT